MSLEAWPAYLPQGFLANGFGYNHQSAVVRTDMETGAARVRQRFTRVPRFVSVTMHMTDTHMAKFDAWVKFKIGFGADWFTMSVPGPTGYESNTVRLLGEYKVSSVGPGHWQVAFELELEDPVGLTEEELE